MWTPKRILLLLAGFSLFVVVYVVYSFFLGGIDGLPPLPSDFGPDRTKVIVFKDQVLPPADAKLCIAFGDNCEELKRAIKVELRSRGLVVATDQFNIIQTDKHRVQLKPFSAAIFGKTHGEGGIPEINTVRSPEAYMIFDRPIENIAEAGDRKIVGAELHGQITMVNNRRTLQKNDDIEVTISNGPLFYSDDQSKIWSDGLVRLKDTQAKPEPIDITAVGLELKLTREAPTVTVKSTPPAKKGASNKNVAGVKELILRSNVDMHFHVDARNGFLGTASKTEEPPSEKKLTLLPDKLQPPAAPTPPPPPAKPAHVVVHTRGQFTYDVEKDVANFYRAELTANEEQAKFPDKSVKVTRVTVQPGGAEQWDQLDCDELKLEFRKKKATDAPANGQSQDGDREIETATAIIRTEPNAVRQGNDPEAWHQVIVSLSTENLHAYCDKLIYHCPTEDRGPETILYGQPMKAIKDGHIITSPEVQLIGANKQGEGQYAYARGPGELHLIDHNEKIARPQYHARWKDSMVVTKDKEGSKLYDLLTFTGDAGFIDDAHFQELHARKLMVWLDQPERLNTEPPAASQKDKAGSGPRQQPHKLEGFEKVRMKSQDMNIKDSDYLIVRFKNEAESHIPDALPAPGEVAPDGKATVKETKPGGSPQPPMPDGVKVADAGKPGVQSDADKKPHKPIEVEAKRISVYVTRTGSKSELEEAVTEGKVHVTQEPASDKEKGVDIKGDLLHLYHYKDGDVLVVFGDPKTTPPYAELKLGDLTLAGPQVTINQCDNTTQIKGDGGMIMPSGTNFDGTKSSKPGVMLNILWKDEMFFNGKEAAFLGNVMAEQDKSKMLCKVLHVYLDKLVSLKEGDKQGGQGAKVERLVASGNVYTEDPKYDDKGQFVRFDRLTGILLTMDNTEDRINVSGPGRVDSLQYGSLDEDNKKPQSTQSKQLYLTRVDYQGRLFSNKNSDQWRVAKFSENVEVYHFPSNTVNVDITPEKLPKDGIYLRADRLTVYSKGGNDKAGNDAADSKGSQKMHGDGNVFFFHKNGDATGAGDVKGKALQLFYNQETDQIILEGTPTNRAILQKSRGPGQPPDEVQARSIVYSRKTGLFHASDVPLIQGFTK